MKKKCGRFEKNKMELWVLHRNSTVARRVTNDTSEHYGNP